MASPFAVQACLIGEACSEYAELIKPEDTQLSWKLSPVVFQSA
jgi:hypothetical protein